MRRSKRSLNGYDEGIARSLVTRCRDCRGPPAGFRDAACGGHGRAHAVLDGGEAGDEGLVLDNGEFAEGWLGGGCVTSAVQRAAKEAIRSGEATLVCLRPEELMADEDGAEQGGEGMVTLARNGCPSKGSMDIFVEPVVPQPELLVFGHGPVARALLRIAAGFGFTLAAMARQTAKPRRLPTGITPRRRSLPHPATQGVSSLSPPRGRVTLPR